MLLEPELANQIWLLMFTYMVGFLISGSCLLSIQFASKSERNWSSKVLYRDRPDTVLMGSTMPHYSWTFISKVNLLKCSCFAVVLAAYAIIQLIISVKETSLVPQSLRRSPATALEGAWERGQKETGARLRKTSKNI